MTKSKVFLVLCVAFVTGVGLAAFIRIPWFVLYISGLIGIAGVVIWWRGSTGVRETFLFMLMIVVGASRYAVAIPASTPEVIHYYNGKEVSFRGVVASEPDVRSDHVKLTVRVLAGLETVPAEVSGRVLINADLYPSYRYGDLLDVQCQIQQPDVIDSADGREFNYGAYLGRYRIYSVCYRPQIDLVASGHGNPVVGVLLQIKNRFIEVMQLSLPEPTASLAGGLLLGAKKAMPPDVMETFNRTGITHIVALSGYNITIIGVMVLQLCQSVGISRRGAFWISLGAISFFIIITGGQASVVRAGIMGMLVLLARQLGRLSRITNALALAAVVMLIINPQVLIFDTGFQLSFLATIGLVYISPAIERYFQRVPKILSLRENLISTLAATIVTVPLLLSQFGRLSAVAPLVNVLVLPVLPLAMGVSFLTGLAAIMWLPLGQIMGWFSWLVLRYILLVPELFSRLSFAAFEFGQVSRAVGAAWYAGLGLFLSWPRLWFKKLMGIKKLLKASYEPDV